MDAVRDRQTGLRADQRGGLPAWTYFNAELLELEKAELFRKSWQIACHVSDVPAAGDYVSFDCVGERALIVRDQAGVVRAFHNVCRHRGSRVVADRQGHCRSAIVCPFHGWSYNLDGSLKAVPGRRNFGELDTDALGLLPLEFEVWRGLVFVRFCGGDDPPVAELMTSYEAEIGPYRPQDCRPLGGHWQENIAANWKSVRDVDNEGYHVPAAHPGLHDLYGNGYVDGPYTQTVGRSEGVFNEDPGRRWSVRHYRRMLPATPHLSERASRSWVYFGLFPNTVLMFYPDCMGYYQEFPLSIDRTLQVGAYYALPDERREMRLARYLSGRIDRDTGSEDTQLIEWSFEAMQSSGYAGIVLSDVEAGVRQYHDQLRARLPVFDRETEPAPGEIAALANAAPRG